MSSFFLQLASFLFVKTLLPSSRPPSFRRGHKHTASASPKSSFVYPWSVSRCKRAVYMIMADMRGGLLYDEATTGLSVYRRERCRRKPSSGYPPLQLRPSRQLPPLPDPVPRQARQVVIAGPFGPPPHSVAGDTQTEYVRRLLEGLESPLTRASSRPNMWNLPLLPTCEKAAPR
jgi:hypothetical protein